MSLIDFVKNNDIDGVRDFLLNENINVNLQDNFGKTALILASNDNNIEIVKLLLEHENINVNLQDYSENTALKLASIYEHIEIVKLLLENENINVNIQDQFGFTALMWASSYGYIEVVKLWLNVETINVNLQNMNGWTALIFASENERIEIVKLLLAKGATVPSNASYSDDVNKVLANWKTYLPRWNRFKTYRYYPKEFNDIIMLWLLICKRKNFVGKDIKLLMIEYFAESWKLNFFIDL